MVEEGGVDEVDKEGWRKEGDSIICVREKVQAAGEGVGSSQEFSWDMDHF